MKRHGDRVTESSGVFRRRVDVGPRQSDHRRLHLGLAPNCAAQSRFLCNGVLQQWRGNSHNAESVLEVWVIQSEDADC